MTSSLPHTGGNQGIGASALLSGKPGPRDDRGGRPAVDDAEIPENGEEEGGG